MSQVVIWGWRLKYCVCIFYTKYTQCQSIICIVSYTGGPSLDSQVAIWGWSQIQGMNLLHKIYTVSIYHMYCIEVVTLG